MPTWENAVLKNPEMFSIGDDGVFEIYADNHTLATLRSCEAFFHESFINRLARKSGGRIWYLEFGIWFHSCVEHFYTEQMAGRFISAPDFVEHGTKLWAESNLNYFASCWDGKPHNGYKALGGITGAVGILVNYWQMYGEGRERLKIIGCELSFGRAQEVKIGEFAVDEATQAGIGVNKVRCYYAGRMDNIVTDDTFVMPMDTKTTSKFSGKELEHFKPHEGMLGYVFALNTMMRDKFPHVNKPALKAVVNHVSVAPCNDYLDRFKRSFISYTPNELDAWRLRQLSSFRRLYDIAVCERTPDWNTSMCSNMFHSNCSFMALHSNDPIHREMIIKSDYIQIEPWNPATISGTRKEEPVKA